MTDAELRDAAWVELTKTTDSYPKWKLRGFPPATGWGRAKSFLDQIGLAPPPPPPPLPPPPPGSWFGLADPWAGVPFGSRPEGPASAPAGAIRLSGDLGGRKIGGFKFTNRPNHVNVIAIENAWNFTLEDIDFENVPEGIYLDGCRDYGIARLRAKNIYGAFKRDGFHSGNLIQINSSQAPRFIRDLKVEQPDTIPTAPNSFDPTSPGYWGTEDIMNFCGTTGGTTASPFKVERFAFYGGVWQSWSGTGILCEGQAHDMWFDNFALVNPGQVGMGFWSPNVKITNGKIWHDQRSFNSLVDGRLIQSNQPFQNNQPGISLGNIKSHFLGGSGLIRGPYGPYVDLGGNDWNATLDKATLRAMCVV